MGRPRDPSSVPSELDRRTWHLWVLSLCISASLALGIAAFYYPAIRWGMVDVGQRYLEILPQLVLGLLTLVFLAGIYVVSKQRELNELRDAMMASHAGISSRTEPYPRDLLTGILDRRALPDVLELEGARADRYAGPFCVVLFNIREFRRINEQEGHLAGDLILKDLAGALQATARKTDVVLRHGPDLFLCLLPATSQENGPRFARRVAKTIEASGRLRKLAIDFGIAEYRSGMSPDGAVAEAEREVDAKKRAGSTAPNRAGEES